jgi:hypothetical protein
MVRRASAAAVTAGLLLAAGFMTANTGWAEDDPAEAMKPRHCVSLLRIDRTDIVDDSNILFYMTNGTIYRNQLPHRCPGLRTADSFMYRTSLNQLCDLDIITVLNSLGFGFMRGPSCGLGSFQPVTKDEVALLKEGGIAADGEAVMPEVERDED